MKPPIYGCPNGRDCPVIVEKNLLRNHVPGLTAELDQTRWELEQARARLSELERERAELLSPANVLREAERLLREAAPKGAEHVEVTLWFDDPEHAVNTNLRIFDGDWFDDERVAFDCKSLADCYAALQSGKGE